MDFIVGQVRWKTVQQANFPQDAKGFDDGRVRLEVQRTPHLKCSGTGSYRNQKKKVLCALVGYIHNIKELKNRYNIQGAQDEEVITELYAQKGLQCITELDGVFTVFMYDEAAQKAFIFQDEYGSCYPFYYHMSGEGLVFGTSLRLLLPLMGLKRRLNMKAVHDFLSYMYTVPSCSTLILGVYKLTAQTYVEVDIERRSVTSEKIERSIEKLSRKDAEGRLIKTVGMNIARLYNQLKREDPCLSYSGGYDSNLILHYLRQLGDFPITAVTIGGQEESEIPKALSILENYQNVAHISSRIQKSMLDSFADIVWKLEGYVCEVGMFMQYELSKVLSREGSNTLFVGDTANEQLSPYREPGQRIRQKRVGLKDYIYQRIISLYKPSSDRVKPKQQDRVDSLKEYLSDVRSRYETSRLPTLMHNEKMYHVIKRSGLIFNGFGIQALYPYLNMDTRNASKALNMDWRRTFYEEQVKKAVDQKIGSHLVTKGGRTDIEYLFAEGKTELLKKVIRTPFFRKILGQKRIDTLLSNADLFFKDYDILSFILTLFYLFVFNELYVSGKYDSQFGNSDLGLSLTEVINGSFGIR